MSPTTTIRRGGQSGSSLLKVMIILTLLGGFLTVAGRVVPGVYNYFLLRDLADRVVGEYATLSLDNVKSRIQFEMTRSQIDVDDETFVVVRSGRGYRVYVDYQISLVFEFKETPLFLKGYETVTLTYETES
ncbi:MAG: hypothetical protein HQL72_01940 [Magnetococcales bacterium]|nr:hypothetical protein [Magnetococcales bacterium]